MNKDKLAQELVNGVVGLTFIKKNKDVRPMKATLCRTIIPDTISDDKIATAIVKNTGDVWTIWDVEKEGWRRFNINTIVE